MCGLHEGRKEGREENGESVSLSSRCFLISMHFLFSRPEFKESVGWGQAGEGERERATKQAWE